MPDNAQNVRDVVVTIIVVDGVIAVVILYRDYSCRTSEANFSELKG